MFTATILKFFSNIDPKVYLGAAVAAWGFWAYAHYDIVSKKDTQSFIENTKELEQTIVILKKTIKSRDIKILKKETLIKLEQSKVEACIFEKEMLEFDCDKEDYNETTINPDSDYLPF